MELVKPITSDHDLIALAKRLNIKLDGVLALQEITKPAPRKGTFIFLLRSDSGVGHSTCMHDNHYFDSMGVGPPTEIGDVPYNEKQIQDTYGEYCGPYCLMWLYAKQHNRMDLLNRFHDLDTDAI
jgi:hypothetical protein